MLDDETLDDIQIMRAIQDMQKTEGWQIVEQHIRGKMETHKHRLLTCDMEDVIKHRSSHKSLELVLIHINDLIKKGQEQLNNER